MNTLNSVSKKSGAKHNLLLFSGLRRLRQDLVNSISCLEVS
jgi:hypothetical protein